MKLSFFTKIVLLSFFIGSNAFSQIDATGSQGTVDSSGMMTSGTDGMGNPSKPMVNFPDDSKQVNKKPGAMKPPVDKDHFKGFNDQSTAPILVGPNNNKPLPNKKND